MHKAICLAVLWVGALSFPNTSSATHTSFQNQLPLSEANPIIRDDESVIAQSRPPVPPLPASIPQPIPPIAEGITGLAPQASELLGVGHLRPSDITFLEQEDWPSSPHLGANWLQSSAVPIYVEPEGNHWGWLLNGWLIPNNQEPLAIGRDATFLMRHTYHALFSFPVTQIRDDGWFQFQYTPAGTAWAHIDHLNLGRMELTVERWENRFLDTGLVQFRSHGLSQPLRSEPASGEEILELIGPDSFIEPVAFEGDWMRVRVTQPTDVCVFLPGARTQEGWMRWRSSDSEPLVWYPPQGC